MEDIHVEVQRGLDQIKRKAAAHEAGHATLHFQAQLFCDVSISEVYNDVDSIIGWSGRCMCVGGDLGNADKWAALTSVAGLIGESLEDDECPDADEIVYNWKMGFAVPSSSDLEAIPPSWSLRQGLVNDALNVLHTRREFWRAIKSRLEIYGRVDSHLAAKLWRKLLAEGSDP